MEVGQITATEYLYISLGAVGGVTLLMAFIVSGAVFWDTRVIRYARRKARREARRQNNERQHADGIDNPAGPSHIQLGHEQAIELTTLPAAPVIVHPIPTHVHTRSELARTPSMPPPYQQHDPITASPSDPNSTYLAPIQTPAQAQVRPQPPNTISRGSGISYENVPTAIAYERQVSTVSSTVPESQLSQDTSDFPRRRPPSMPLPADPIYESIRQVQEREQQAIEDRQRFPEKPKVQHHPQPNIPPRQTAAQDTHEQSPAFHSVQEMGPKMEEPPFRTIIDRPSSSRQSVQLHSYENMKTNLTQDTPAKKSKATKPTIEQSEDKSARLRRSDPITPPPSTSSSFVSLSPKAESNTSEDITMELISDYDKHIKTVHEEMAHATTLNAPSDAADAGDFQQDLPVEVKEKTEDPLPSDEILTQHEVACSSRDENKEESVKEVEQRMDDNKLEEHEDVVNVQGTTASQLSSVVDVNEQEELPEDKQKEHHEDAGGFDDDDDAMGSESGSIIVEMQSSENAAASEEQPCCGADGQDNTGTTKNDEETKQVDEKQEDEVSGRDKQENVEQDDQSEDQKNPILSEKSEETNNGSDVSTSVDKGTGEITDDESDQDLSNEGNTTNVKELQDDVQEENNSAEQMHTCDLNEDASPEEHANELICDGNNEPQNSLCDDSEADECIAAEEKEQSLESNPSHQQKQPDTAATEEDDEQPLVETTDLMAMGETESPAESVLHDDQALHSELSNTNEEPAMADNQTTESKTDALDEANINQKERIEDEEQKINEMETHYETGSVKDDAGEEPEDPQPPHVNEEQEEVTNDKALTEEDGDEPERYTDLVMV